MNKVDIQGGMFSSPSGSSPGLRNDPYGAVHRTKDDSSSSVGGGEWLVADPQDNQGYSLHSASEMQRQQVAHAMQMQAATMAAASPSVSNPIGNAVPAGTLTIDGQSVDFFEPSSGVYTLKDGSTWHTEYDIRTQTHTVRPLTMTPEGKVKHKIKDILKEYGAYWYMPVSSGMGAPQLDFMCSIFSTSKKVTVAFYIEAKAEGKKPTERQQYLIDVLRKEQHAQVFVIDGTDYSELDLWLLSHTELTPKES
jgi:hypothetical protein